MQIYRVNNEPLLRYSMACAIISDDFSCFDKLNEFAFLKAFVEIFNCFMTSSNKLDYFNLFCHRFISRDDILAGSASFLRIVIKFSLE